MTEIFSIYGVSVVAITMALSQIIKKYIPEKVVVLLPLVLGVVIMNLARWDISASYVLEGLVIGLAAMGVFKVDHDLVGIGRGVREVLNKLK